MEDDLWFKKLNPKDKKFFKDTEADLSEIQHGISLDHPSLNKDDNEKDQSEKDKLEYKGQGKPQLNENEKQWERVFNLDEAVALVFFHAKVRNLIDKQKGPFWIFFRSLKKNDRLRRAFEKWIWLRGNFEEEQANDFAGIMDSLIVCGADVPSKKNIQDALISYMMARGKSLSEVQKTLCYLDIKRTSGVLRKRKERLKKKRPIREKIRLILTDPLAWFMVYYMSKDTDKK